MDSQRKVAEILFCFYCIRIVIFCMFSCVYGEEEVHRYAVRTEIDFTIASY